ncbi:MAG: PaaI family thioesterase [Actinomycetota bacterium]
MATTPDDRPPIDVAGWLRRDEGAETDRDRALHEVAESTRRLVHRLHATEAPLEVLDGLATAIGGMARLLEAHPQGRQYEGFAEASTAGAPSAFFAFSPIIGLANPLAPPLAMRVDGEVVHGTGTFGAAYEGPPGHVHGGYIAAAFDELLGMAQSLTGNPGMTGTLTVRYRTPTPLHEELRLVGMVDEVDGRKIFTSGRMYAGDRLTAEADGVFVSIDFERMAMLAEERSTER